MKCEITIDDQQMVEQMLTELKQQHFISDSPNVTIIYHSDSKDLLYTVQEVSELLKTSTNKVYDLINFGLLPCLNFGSKKVRRVTLLNFLEKYEGVDLSEIPIPSK